MAELGTTLDLADRSARGGSSAFAGRAFRRRTIRCGSIAAIDLGPFTIAYQTYGTLNAERSNAVLICHALTGDQYVANPHPVTGKPGWWETMVGPGRPIDTDRYFVICANVLGGCMGTTGPASTNPATGEPWASIFRSSRPRHGAGADAAARPSRHRHAVRGHRRIDGRDAGPAMGGELSRAGLRRAADRGRDPAFGAEHRLPRGRPAGDHGGPGLARRALSASRASIPGAASPSRAWRRTSLICPMPRLHRKFGRRLQDRDNPTFSFDADFQVESYLRHQGITFVERFDANSYLYMTRAMDYFDLAADYDGVVANGVPGHADALLRDLVHQRLAVPDAGIARHRARAQCRAARASLLRKSRPTRGTTHSCSTSRNCLRSCAVSWKGRRGAQPAAGAEMMHARAPDGVGVD